MIRVLVGLLDLRHRHGEAFDDHIVVERLQNVSRDQRVINPGVFIRMQASEVLLANVDHLVSLQCFQYP